MLKRNLFLIAVPLINIFLILAIIILMGDDFSLSRQFGQNFEGGKYYETWKQLIWFALPAISLIFSLVFYLGKKEKRWLLPIIFLPILITSLMLYGTNLQRTDLENSCGDGRVCIL